MAGFNPQDHLMKLKGKEYLEVKWRLVWLREVHPDATITTELVERKDNHAIFRAEVTLPSGASATGWGSEDTKGFAEYIEKAETKAIGRALGALGFGTQFADDFADASGPLADAPVSRLNAPSESVTAPPDAAKAMKRVHAVAAEHGVSHDDLHNWAVSKNLGSLKRATASQLDTMSDFITNKPDEAREHFKRLATVTEPSLPGVSGGSHRNGERFTR